jgi:hypothetical protein
MSNTPAQAETRMVAIKATRMNIPLIDVSASIKEIITEMLWQLLPTCHLPGVESLGIVFSGSFSS